MRTEIMNNTAIERIYQSQHFRKKYLAHKKINME